MKLLESYKDIAKLFIIEDEEPEKEEPEDKKLDKGMDDEEDYEREFDESKGGMQKRKNKQKRGYEPVESIQINGQKYKRVS